MGSASKASGRSVSATRSRSARCACGWTGRGLKREGGVDPMTVAVRALNRVGIRPRLRRRELGLLVLVAITLTVGWASYVSYRDGALELVDTGVLASYLVMLAGIHIVFVLTGRRMDEVLFPAAALLAGISLLMMQRLPQDLVT